MGSLTKDTDIMIETFGIEFTKKKENQGVQRVLIILKRKLMNCTDSG